MLFTLVFQGRGKVKDNIEIAENALSLLVVGGDQIEHFDKVTDEETPMVPR